MVGSGSGTQNFRAGSGIKLFQIHNAASICHFLFHISVLQYNKSRIQANLSALSLFAGSRQGVPISLLKKFRFKAKLSETQTVSLPFRETLGKKFRFVSLQKFRFVSLKNMFRFGNSFASNFLHNSDFCYFVIGPRGPIFQSN